MVDFIGQQLGNYRLLRLLGQGACAAVYLGEHQYLERPAAVKVLHMQMAPSSHEAFRREARTIAQLDHPHIIGVHDFGIEGQIPYLVMEYMPNGTLRSQHPQGTRLPFELILNYVKQIASALDYAHEQQVIHRDIKPENILLNARQKVVLSDFGIAVVEPSLASLSGQSQVGTPIYMAPEQIQGKPCAASDQYALGVMVYEWLCGDPPFDGPSLTVFLQHLREQPSSLRVHLPHLSPAVENVILRALAKNPQDRFSTVQDFATGLEEAFLATRPLSLQRSPEYTPQDQITPPLAHAIAVSTPLPGEQNYSADKIQPWTKTTLPIALALQNQNRQRLLRRVRSFWITGVLEQSLHGVALMALGLKEHPDAVANPWKLMLHSPDMAPRPLPTGTRITQVYDNADGELLILGAPGAGKTTLLLELARDLLERAESDEQHPMPVVFNLSSWAIKRQHLTDWLVEELNNRYLVPRELAQALVKSDQILPLLDGLDEVTVEKRTACIEAINTYRLEHGLRPLVVCSRSADYLTQTARVRLGSAVMVQPLTQEQVIGYLSTADSRVKALLTSLQLDPDLQELATTPLMLNIFILAYQGIPLNQIAPLGTLSVKQQQVFATYVQRMLTGRSATMHYTPEQTLPWLSFLAQKMKQYSQTVFYIEHMQPDWLVDKRMLRKYDWLAVRLPYILIGILVSLAPYPLFFQTIWTPYLPEIILLGGLLGWLLSGGSTTQQSPPGSRGQARRLLWYRLVQQLGLAALLGIGMGLSLWQGYDDPLRGLVAGLSFGLCCLLLMLLLRRNHTLQAPLQGTPQRRPVRDKVVLNTLLVGLLAGLSNALGVALDAELNIRLLTGLLFLLLGGLSGGILSALLIGRHTVVQPTDRLIWTWQSFGRSLFSKRHVKSTLLVTGVGLLLFSTIVWLAGGTVASIVVLGLLFGSVLGLLYWLLLGFFRGVASTTIDDQLRMVPNQGIRRSGLNALRYGLVVAIVVGLVGSLLSTTWVGGLIIGLSVGLLTGLFNGGIACLRHAILRILLWRSGAIPRNYPRFLDAVSERLLLRKVGGGYIFLHRLLLDYLAIMGTNELAGQRDATPLHPITPTALLPCGHELRPNARFCSVCGAAIPVTSLNQRNQREV